MHAPALSIVCAVCGEEGKKPNKLSSSLDGVLRVCEESLPRGVVAVDKTLDTFPSTQEDR